MNDNEWVLKRERKKAREAAGTGHLDCIRTTRTSADSKQPTETAAGTTEKGKKNMNMLTYKF